MTALKDTSTHLICGR